MMDTILNSNNYPKSDINQVHIIGRNKSMKIWPFLEIPGKEDPDKPVLYSFNQPSDKSVGTVKPFLDTREEDNATHNDLEDSESFHSAIGSILGIAQLFGILPLSGVRSSLQNLFFHWHSPRTFYCTVIMILLIFMAITSVLHMIKNLRADTIGLNDGIAAATSGAIFYGNSLIGLGMFMWLSPRWILLQKEWRSMELYLDRCAQSKPKLQWKFWIISIFVMGIALVEHILSIIVNIPEKEVAALYENVTWKDYLRIYSIRSHGFVLSTFNYNTGLGIFLFIISKMATFTWNFTDLFIMLVSTGLAERYKRLNQVLLKDSQEKIATINWHEFRKFYAILSMLVKRTDDYISPIILLSFLNNLYFICLQLLNGFSFESVGVVHTAYFFISVGLLVGRTIAVILFASRINDHSKILLPVLYNCPASNFTSETQRLQVQLTSDDICLTGLKFFCITRKFMLAVAGAIATYEVVLLQFNVAMHK